MHTHYTSIQTNKSIALNVCTVLVFIQAFVHIQATSNSQSRTAALTFHALPILHSSLNLYWYCCTDLIPNWMLHFWYCTSTSQPPLTLIHTGTQTRTYSHTSTQREQRLANWCTPVVVTYSHCSNSYRFSPFAAVSISTSNRIPFIRARVKNQRKLDYHLSSLFWLLFHFCFFFPLDYLHLSKLVIGVWIVKCLGNVDHIHGLCFCLLLLLCFCARFFLVHILSSTTIDFTNQCQWNWQM